MGKASQDLHRIKATMVNVVGKANLRPEHHQQGHDTCGHNLGKVCQEGSCGMFSQETRQSNGSFFSG